MERSADCRMRCRVVCSVNGLSGPRNRFDRASGSTTVVGVKEAHNHYAPVVVAAVQDAACSAEGGVRQCAEA